MCAFLQAIIQRELYICIVPIFLPRWMVLANVWDQTHGPGPYIDHKWQLFVILCEQSEYSFVTNFKNGTKNLAQEGKRLAGVITATSELKEHSAFLCSPPSALSMSFCCRQAPSEGARFLRIRLILNWFFIAVLKQMWVISEMKFPCSKESWYASSK